MGPKREFKEAAEHYLRDHPEHEGRAIDLAYELQSAAERWLRKANGDQPAEGDEEVEPA